MNIDYEDQQLTDEPILLIVDDEVMQEVMLKAPIERKQIKVIFCQSGPECLEVLKSRNDISLVLLDLIMPEMNGFQTMQEISQLSNFVPVIAVSASATDNDIEKAKSFGFEDILLKPLNIDEIAKTFDNFSNQININESPNSSKPENNIKQIIQHLEDSNDLLIAGFRRQDINQMKQALHSMRENTLIAIIRAIPMQIEIIQKAFINGAVSGAQIIDLNNFIKHFIKAEYNKLHQ